MRAFFENWYPPARAHYGAESRAIELNASSEAIATFTRLISMNKRTDRPAMLPRKGEPPGMERDSHGHAIPLKERLPEDREKAKRAGKKEKANGADA